ncbi:phosphoribosylaminoimidazole synthetase [candidate division TA06 bacterium DG_24]|uniref:Phosphoribosylformylglycinamidine cyclo-ligase n=3 Tax=Bacteria division TA06 TaxID=1156500 RepID=A0A0S8JM24_UNCT6|nr:MAG: phosphoribosylaminoimidazole synthetase [candidate division TA06 bacterium DG_24]KPK68349.1 MAG: phosphoribosylaminoimidazole synthetase [candidate division TA06 bacterium SM23_40]KPL10291.1 MAG: phosphoribosylaminoimidazole synthetase [candidate division TA06 bacterium SM1_40]
MRELRYRDAGVDRDTVHAAMARMKAEIAKTFDDRVLGAVGRFAGLYRADLGDLEVPVLAASVDGVGTKLRVAFAARIHNTVGQDLVHHCANDILVHGARPLFFLDYVASGKLDEETTAGVLRGFVTGCQTVGCALIGGETAEMPGFYQGKDYDLVGFIVGIVDGRKIIDGTAIRSGHKVIGLASNGLHTNGYSLARAILFERQRLGLDDVPEGWDCSVKEELLKIHRWYGDSVLGLLDRGMVSGMAHITGGGLVENLPRVLPSGLSAELDTNSWETPKIFSFLAEHGPVEKEEMFRVFNMGIGFVLTVEPEKVPLVCAELERHGERAQVIGRITEGDGQVVLR